LVTIQSYTIVSNKETGRKIVSSFLPLGCVSRTVACSELQVGSCKKYTLPDKYSPSAEKAKELIRVKLEHLIVIYQPFSGVNQFRVPVCQEGEEGNFKPCLIEDEGGPLEAAMQVEASNRRKLLW